MEYAAALPSRDRPLPAEMLVRDALAAFLAENGYDAADYDAPRTPAKLLGVRFSVPNPPRHRWSIMRHDLHHIATGYGTDLPGEAEMSAWELRRGIRPVGWYVGVIVLSAFLFGFVYAPRRTLGAYRRAGRGANLFKLPCREYETLLEMRLGDLRESIALPAEGVATRRRGLNGMAPNLD